MSGQHLRSNNPFAQDAEEEIQSHISDSNGLSRQSSINRGAPDPSILESDSTDNVAAVDGNGTVQQNSGSNNSLNNSTTNVPTIHIDQLDSSQIDGEGSLARSTSRLSSISLNNNNGSVPDWQQVDGDTNPDEPPPAYSEVDPNNTSEQSQQQSTNLDERPVGEPPRSPSSSSQYQRPSVPPPPPRVPSINTQFYPPPPGPPPPSQFAPPPGPPPPHLSPQEVPSPRLPPRPTSPRLPPRPNVPRRNMYPGASGATYSSIGAPPLPHRR